MNDNLVYKFSSMKPIVLHQNFNFINRSSYFRKKALKKYVSAILHIRIKKKGWEYDEIR